MNSANLLNGIRRMDRFNRLSFPGRRCGDFSEGFVADMLILALLLALLYLSW